MSYIPTRTNNPAVDRNLRDIADALENISTGTTTTVVSISGGTGGSGSTIINWGTATGVGAAGITVTFSTAFSSADYTPAYMARAGSEDVQCDVQILSATQMKLVPLGRTGVTIRWSAIGS